MELRAVCRWDRMPFLTTVKNGTKTVEAAYNHLEANMFFSGSPFAIDTDDGPSSPPSIQKGTRVLISLWDSLMFGRVLEY